VSLSRIGEVVRSPQPDDEEVLEALASIRRSHERMVRTYRTTAASDEPERGERGKRPDWMVDR
jgi:hypothetical protein